MIFFLFVTLAITIAFFIQEFIPFFEWAYYSRLLLVHTVFYCAAVSVPFPAMLLLALFTGFIWEARYHLPVYTTLNMGTGPTQAELPFGFSIFIFGLMGSFIQGVRPLFRRGRWELPVFLIGICTAGGMIIEYLMISFHRGGLEVPPELWWKMLMTALFSTLVSPFLLLLFSRLADRVGFKIRMEGITRRYSYDGDTF